MWKHSVTGKHATQSFAVMSLFLLQQGFTFPTAESDRNWQSNGNFHTDTQHDHNWHEQYFPCETAVKQCYLKHVISLTPGKWLHWWAVSNSLFTGCIWKWVIRITSKPEPLTRWVDVCTFHMQPIPKWTSKRKINRSNNFFTHTLIFSCNIHDWTRI